MNRRRLGFTTVHIAVAFVAWNFYSLFAAAAPKADSASIRPEPKLVIYPKADIENQSLVADSTPQPPGVSADEAGVWSFLAGKAEEFKLPSGLSNLKLVATKKSLLGTHYYFQQLLSGIDVDRATIVVSTDSKGRVTSVHDAIVPVPTNKVARANKAEVKKEDAFKTAWAALGAQVEPNKGLYGEPKAMLTYTPDASGFRLAYSVEMYVVRKRESGESEPGLWRVLIDAVSGEVIGKPEKLSANGKHGGPESYQKQAGEWNEAIQKFESHQAANKTLVADTTPSQTVDGTGLVFDPDPMSILQNTSLTDTSPANAFDAAYTTVVLRDITKRGNKYFLEGPWVRIEDFEAPNTAPSTTNDGNWKAKRGDNAFNDVMTYYHIDQSQRYIQSLGFTSIQALSMPADSDGFGGTDNSHYLSDINSISFGHGCIDDNEDADVILHEYGHAITNGINPAWGGGDSRAIGEGFGDYWAETSSFAKANGSTFQLFRVFDWDGVGCWGGRRLDIKPTDATYDPSQTYTDHEDIGHGVQSDELWSTPLYQAHLQLREAGIPREEIDKIVLESMFGVGANFTMRQLADRVVHTAQTLFPAGPHAAAFEKQFKAFKILP